MQAFRFKTDSIPFTKYSGSGNDFILVDNRRRVIPEIAGLDIPRLCNRHWGIGADGLLLLELSYHADFRMRYWNCDGSIGSLCGNGLRCFAHFILQLGCSPQPFRIETDDQILQVDYAGEEIVAEMGSLQEVRWEIPFSFENQRWSLHFLRIGVPHVVLFIEENLSTFPLEIVGPLLRSHSLFGTEGANVNIAQCTREGISLRTFERGVEAETLACGTGATASAIAAHHLFRTPSPISVMTQGGDSLKISFDESYSTIHQRGQAHSLFSGVFPLPLFTFSERAAHTVERKLVKNL